MKRLILKGVNLNHFPEITPVSDSQIQVVLEANSQQHIDIPEDARYVVFNYDNDVYVNYDANAKIPTDSPSVLPTSSEYNPGQRFIVGFHDIRIKSKYVTHVHLSFFS